MPHVRIYPYKEVETGAQVYENLIWETRASSRLFGRDGVSGLVNVDLTPETAARLATALGTALKRGARVVAEPRLRPRLPDDQARDDLRPERGGDRRRRPARLAAGGRPARAEDAGLRGRQCTSARAISTRKRSSSASTSRPGSCSRQACRRRSRRTSRARSSAASTRAASARSPTRRECARATRRTCSARWTPRRSASARFRIVVDYGYSAASFVLPLVVGPLGVEAVSAHGFFADELGERGTLAQAIGHTKRLVTAIGADLGAVFDQSGERLYLVDEQGHEVPVDQALLLFVRLLAERGRRGRSPSRSRSRARSTSSPATGSRSCGRRTRSPT